MTSIEIKIKTIQQGREIKKWLSKNVPDDKWNILSWGLGSKKEIFFVREEDAVLFSLRWL